MVTFQGPKGSREEEGFAKWRREHPEGFFINYGSPSDIMLHRQSCRHFDFRKPVGLTSYKKVCSTDRQELVRWAATHGSLRFCSTCSPRT